MPADTRETTRLLRDLVALPSVNPMGRPNPGPECFEHRVTAYLEDFFRGLGVPFERQAVAPQRDNIVARFEPAGAPRSVLFEVHQDTVPTDGMTIDPFGARVEGGKLYGLSHKKKGQWFCVDAATGKTLWLTDGRQAENAAILAGGKPLDSSSNDERCRVGKVL